MPDDNNRQEESQEEDLSPEDIAAIREENAQLKKEFGTTKERLSEVSHQLMDPDYLEYLASKREGKSQRRESPDPVTPARDPEEMTNTELVQYVVESIRKDFGKVGEVIDGELNKVNVAIEDMKTAREIDRVATANKDFWDYKDEIYALAKSRPHLSPTEAYKIVKSDKLSAKERSDAANARTREKRASSERPGGIASKSTKSPRPRKLDEAFDEAYAMAFGDDE